MDGVDTSALAAETESRSLLDNAADVTGVARTPQVQTATWGFYLYSWAIEVYAVVSLTLFLPITLEQYAREAGRLASNHDVPCTESTDVCSISILGLWINTASFSLYTYSISVALQAITVIAISKRANKAQARKKLLTIFTLLGSVSCAVFLFIPSQSILWPLSSLLTISGNVAFGASIVCLNAFLPIIARAHLKQTSDELDDRVTNETLQTSHEVFKATSEISSKGIAAGYGAGILLLVLMLIPVTLMKGSLFSLRLAIAASGVWWLAFGIPALAFLPASTETVSLSPPTTGTSPWSELFSILKNYRKLPETFKYLLAWFIMSDAFATITSTAILFAKTTLGMSAQELVWVGVLTPLAGIVGALAWPKVQHRWLGTTDLQTLRMIVALASLIPLWGLVALNTSVELLLLACYFGALYGALQAYSRACFSHLIPPSEEARFFALYSITDKSSSFIGPAVVAIIADRTGSVRAGFVFLLVALLLPLPVLRAVDMLKGREEAANLQTSKEVLVT